MGKMKENPRYNIVSTRISDAALEAMSELYPGSSRAEILSEALADKIIRDRQNRIDGIIEMRL